MNPTIGGLNAADFFAWAMSERSVTEYRSASAIHKETCAVEAKVRPVALKSFNAGL